MSNDDDLLKCCREVSSQLAADISSWRAGAPRSFLFARNAPGNPTGVLKRSNDVLNAAAVNDIVRRNTGRAQERFIVQAVPQLRMLSETQGEGAPGPVGKVGFLFTASPCPLRTSLGVIPSPSMTVSPFVGVGSRSASAAPSQMDANKPTWNASTLSDTPKKRSSSTDSHGAVRSRSRPPLMSPDMTTSVPHVRSGSDVFTAPRPHVQRPTTSTSSGLNQSLALDISIERPSHVGAGPSPPSGDAKAHFQAFLCKKPFALPPIDLTASGNKAGAGEDHCESLCRYHLRLLNLAVPTLEEELSLSMLQSPIRNGELLCVLLNAGIMGLRSVAADALSSSSSDSHDPALCEKLLKVLHPVAHRRLLAGGGASAGRSMTVRGRIEGVLGEVLRTLETLAALLPRVSPLQQATRCAFGSRVKGNAAHPSDGLLGVLEGRMQPLWAVMYILCRVFFQNNGPQKAKRADLEHSRAALGDLDRSVHEDTQRIVTRSSSAPARPSTSGDVLSPTRQWAFYKRHGEHSMQSSPMPAARSTTGSMWVALHSTDDSKRLDYAVCQFLMELQILPELGSLDGRGNKLPMSSTTNHRMKVMQSQFLAAMDDPTKAPYVPESMTYRATVRDSNSRSMGVDRGQGRMSFQARVSELTTILSPTLFPYLRNGTVLYDAAMKLTGDYSPEDTLRGPGTLSGRSTPTTFTRNPKLRKACEANIELAQLLLLKHSADSDPPMCTACLTDPSPIFNGDVPFILTLLEDMMRYAFKQPPRTLNVQQQGPSTPFIPPAYRVPAPASDSDQNAEIQQRRNVRSVPMGPSDGVPFPPHGEGFAFEPIPETHLWGPSAAGSLQSEGGGEPSNFGVSSLPRSSPQLTAYLRPPPTGTEGNSSSRRHPLLSLTQPPPPSPHLQAPQPQALTNGPRKIGVSFGGVVTSATPSQLGDDDDEVDGTASEGGLSRRSSRSSHMLLHLDYLSDVHISDRECLLLGGWLVRKLKASFKHSPLDGSFVVDFSSLSSEVDALAPIYEVTSHRGGAPTADHQTPSEGPAPPRARFMVLSDGVVLFRLIQALVSSSDSNALSSGVQLRPKTDAAKKQNLRKVVAFMKEKLKILGGCLAIEDALFQGEARAVVLVLRSLKHRFKHHS